MVKVILVGLAGSLLLLLLLFLIVVIKDHRRSKEIQKHLKPSLKKEGAPLSEEKEEPATPPPPPKEPHPLETEQNVEAPETTETPRPEPLKEPPEHTEKPTVPEAAEISEPAETTEQTETSLAEQIRQKDYGTFDHSRLIEEMGLAEEEVAEFIVELIHQIETALPDIEKEVEAGNREKMERITHGLKGAALNLGNGGITDLLVEYNTYLKQSGDPSVVHAFQERLKEHLSKIKTRYAIA